MKKLGEAKLSGVIRKCIGVLMCLLFLPMLFCVMFIGNNMDYFDDGAKAELLVPSAVLSVAAVAALIFCIWLLRLGKKIEMPRRLRRLLGQLLVILYIGFYFLVLWLAREVVFDLSGDMLTVRESAKDFANGTALGYRFYFSIYYNNIPILYILGRLYRLAQNLNWFQHDPEYLWVIVGCLMTTGAGFSCCEIVKKITRNVAAVALSFVLYLLTAGISPWKAVPYTDSYGIFFPILCIFLYLCSKDCKHNVWKTLLLFLAVLAGIAGGLIKPSGYIAVLAVLGAEGVAFIGKLPGVFRVKSEGIKPLVKDAALKALPLCLTILFFALGYWGAGRFTDYMITDMQFDYNAEIEASWQYYLLLGSNNESTGAYNYEDYAVFAEFQESKSERDAVCLERAWARISERGILGNMYFGLLKLVRCFNDGTFFWQDTQYYEPFPEELMHDTPLANLVRSFFFPGGSNQVKYNTLAQLVWIFILMGVPGILLLLKRKPQYIVFPVMVIGILLYLMLFEAGARYVYIFLPLFVTMAVCGMERTGSALCDARGRLGRKSETASLE